MGLDKKISMRAKFIVESITQYENQETLKMRAVGPNGTYPKDGSDEDNSHAKSSPSASLEISITNPDLHGKFEAGQKFFCDFTPAE